MIQRLLHVAILGMISVALTTDAVARKRECPLHGLAFGPYLTGQDPGDGVVLDEAQLRERLTLLQGRTLWIRSYGSTHGLETIGRLAHEAGFQTAIGAWLGRDPAANEEEIANLIVAAQAGDAEIAIVGSEVLLRGDLSSANLLAYVARVRDALPERVQVTTAEPYGVWAAHPELVDAVDVVLAHFYPFWEGYSIDDAIAQVHVAWRSLTAQVAPKVVIVAETGWPSAGESVGPALPSSKNADSYLLRFLTWAESNEVPYFFFEAFDEAWKVRLEGERGAHWGVSQESGRPKKGLKRALRCKRWKRPEPGFARIPDVRTPGDPLLTVDFLPPLGSTQDLRGGANFLVPVDWAVAVYIYVPGAGGWWTKPTFAVPKVPLAATGAWQADITTGGIDPTATQIAAFLVPWNFAPPRAAGSSDLPDSLFEAAADWIIAER